MFLRRVPCTDVAEPASNPWQVHYSLCHFAYPVVVVVSARHLILLSPGTFTDRRQKEVVQRTKTSGSECSALGART